VLIKKEMVNSRLLLILGKEPIREYNKILYLINELELKDHIRLLDPVPYTELPKYVSLADLVVVPSLSEGFGFTAAESAAMGKPVVGTYSGSLPEIINHGKTGLLVKPRSPDEIYEAVCRLLKDEKDLQGMGKNAQKKVSKLNWEKTINLLEELYVRLLT
ncbi:MAG: glycosyltransferase family 4 protein, partial [Candidatus Bathyarchaeota archaeon]|nr:glycosyltransferase family 4 protein [Candidatus Bathyarchaeota archaeon]